MPTKILLYIVVFGGVFYLIKALFPFFQEKMERWQRKRIEKLAPKLDSMFLDVSSKRLLLIDIIAPIACAALGYAFTRNIGISLGAGAVGLVVPIIVVKRLEALRREKFSSQLVDGLLILSSSLKAGLSLLQSFEELAGEMPAPISQEFGLVIRQMKMGVSFEEAIVQLKKRMRVPDLDMVVTSILVARETGGDLTITFSRVIETIQERNKLVGRVKALTIQGKLQGLIMSLLPIAFGAFVYKVNPGFFDIFFKDSLGKTLLAYAVISEILGAFFIHKMSKIDI